MQGEIGLALLMPRGTHHVETGLLLCDGPGLVLQRDDGGHWRLDAPGRAGFDLLDVVRIERITS